MLRGQTPPQGYAKDVLVQAYNWIMSQPETVKSQATSADALVVLFNRARRGGEAPVSSEKFRSELKDIATELKNFSDPETTRLQTEASQLDRSIQEELSRETPREGTRHNGRQLPLDFQRGVLRPTMIEESVPERSTPQMDARSIEMLHKVRGHLNLSSDSEALRMLIVLGFERLQSLFR